MKLRSLNSGLKFLHFTDSRVPAPEQNEDKLSEKNYSTVEYEHEEGDARVKEMREKVIEFQPYSLNRP